MSGGTIRLKDEHWQILTNLAVECSSAMKRPVNQSKVLQAILNNCQKRCKNGNNCDLLKQGKIIEYIEHER